MNYKFACGAALLILAGCASAADQQVEGLLAHMRDAYKTVKSATYNTTTTVYGPDGSQEYTCDFAYKRPNMIRVIIKGAQLHGQAVTEISNGTDITISTPEGAMPPQKFSDDTIEKGLPANLESLCFWDWDRQLSTTAGKNMAQSTFKLIRDEEWNGKHWMVLEETAKKDNVLCRYFIDPKTYLIWRTRVKDLSTGKDQLDSQITRLNPDADLTDSMFTGT